MKEEKVLILGRLDLHPHASKKRVKDVSHIDFLCPVETFYKENLILFVDDNGTTRVLKNRYGDRGIVKKD